MSRKTAKTAKKSAPAKPAKPDARSGKYLADSREAGVTWPAILTATGAGSAIPLRKTLARFLLADAKNEERYPNEYAKVAPIAAKSDGAKAREAVRLRDERGEGFPRIAARLGVSENEAKALYAKGGGISPDGRVYVGSAGRTLVLRPGESAPIAAKPAKRKGGRKGGRKPAKAKG